jgi:hypothetical protein
MSNASSTSALSRKLAWIVINPLNLTGAISRIAIDVYIYELTKPKTLRPEEV